jgi:integrase
MAIDLSKVGRRSALKPRREPYWHRIRPGCFLGYRRPGREGAGTWIARAYDEDTQRYQFKAIGDLGSLEEKDKFAAAKKEAEHFADLIQSGGEAKAALETVAQACRAYAIRNPEAAGRFERHVYGEPLAKVRLSKLRRHHLREWRQSLAAKPALVSRAKNGEQRTRPRSPASLNRDMAVLRAALNRVLAPGQPDTDAAWQEALRPIKNADRQRSLYLDRDQRRALLAQLSSEARPFVQALCSLPLRPGAAASLKVGDFDKRTNELSIGKDKNGKPRRIVVPTEAARLFSAQITDKLPSAHLFTRKNGKTWDKETWKLPIRAAAKAADLPESVTAYTLRHSTITDLVSNGLAILTVAQISGTSVEMIERHYGHLVRDAATEALAKLQL